MPDQGGEKTEAASPKKRQDERKKGNIFMSKDVTTVLTLIASFYIIKEFIMTFLIRLELNFQNQLMRAETIKRLTTEEIMNLFTEVAVFIVTTIMPPMLIIGAVSVIATMAQTKFLFVTEPMKFKMSRLNPLQGIKKMFSLKSVVELAKSLVKTAVIIGILYNNVVKVIQTLPAVIDFGIMQAAVFTGEHIMSLLMTVGIAFSAVAAADFLYQRWDYEKNIKMTKQEVKDEYKQMEGNPEIKSARRQKQREFAQQRMMNAVQHADVVVRNPTHYAVALRYKLDEDVAPVVLAKGVDHLAMRIVQEAEKHGIETVENPPLARGLYAAADIEEMIPAEFFQPVAELLAMIFTERKEKEKRQAIYGRVFTGQTGTAEAAHSVERMKA